MEYAYCAVRTESLNTVQVNLNLDGRVRVMVQAVSRRPLTTEARFRSQANNFEFCGGESSTVTGSSPITSLFPFQYHPTSAPKSSSTTRCFHKDKDAKPGNSA